MTSCCFTDNLPDSLLDNKWSHHKQWHKYRWMHCHSPLLSLWPGLSNNKQNNLFKPSWTCKRTPITTLTKTTETVICYRGFFFKSNTLLLSKQWWKTLRRTIKPNLSFWTLLILTHHRLYSAVCALPQKDNRVGLWHRPQLWLVHWVASYSRLFSGISSENIDRRLTAEVWKIHIEDTVLDGSLSAPAWWPSPGAKYIRVTANLYRNW